MSKVHKLEESLEDRITYILSEWLNDSAPLFHERYRAPAKAVIKEIEEFNKRLSRKPKRARKSG